MKSEVDIKNLTDVVKKQLKLKINAVDINLDKLFQEVGAQCYLTICQALDIPDKSHVYILINTHYIVSVIILLVLANGGRY